MSGSPSLKPITALQENAPPASFWPRGWWAIVDYKISVIPIPVYLLVLAFIAGFTFTGKVPSDLPMSIVLLAVGGFTWPHL